VNAAGSKEEVVMSRTRMALKVVLVVALIAAGMERRFPAPPWFGLALVLLGIANVVFSPPGTAWVRGVAVTAVIGTLLWPQPPWVGMVFLLLWLAWPPALLLAWFTARQRESMPDTPSETPGGAREARLGAAVLIAAIALASLAYRALVWHRLDQTAALFIGVPTTLSLVVVFFVKPQSATGVACKAVTLGLLASLLFLWEGMLCVVMSAPLFLAVAVMIGSAIDRLRRGPDRSPPTVLSCIALLALGPMSLEGVTGWTTLNRTQEVSETRIVHASADEVERAILRVPRFERALPMYLRAGFPRPIATQIESSRGPEGVAGRWVVRMRGGEMRLNGMEPRVGDLVLDIAETRPGYVRWQVASDESHMTHFLRWREARLRWEAVGSHATKVTWTLAYDRALDPAWYFGPWERYAARLAAGYLIDAVATP
jgi:hypothetical protein